MMFTEYTGMHIPFFRLMQIALPLSFIFDDRSYPLLTDQTQIIYAYIPSGHFPFRNNIHPIYILSVKSSFLTSRARRIF